ncbi:MAG: SBBP repeat-containing protein [Terracidiphilus sp.]
MKVYAALPMSFEANLGQSDPRVRFLAHAPGYMLFLTDQEAVLSLPADSSAPKTAQLRHPAPQSPIPLREEASHMPRPLHAVRLRFIGASKPTAIGGRDPLPGKTNYFIGNDLQHWHTNVPNYSAVDYQNLYPGVNALFRGDNRRLEFDFNIAPGADPRAIALQVDGARRIRLNRAGDVLLRMDAARDIVMGKPHIYQQSPEGRREIAGHYVLGGHHRIAFAFGSYDHAQPLVIDPTVEYATYLGGSIYDYAEGVAVDSLGNAYVAGFTSSTDFPEKNGYESTCGDCTGGQYAGEGFVTKLNAAGSALVYSTFLSGVDIYAVAVDPSGSAYVAGGAGFAEASGAPGFPVVNAFQSTSHGSIENAFVTKLSPDGSSLIYSTYLGGSYSDEAFGIAVDSLGSAYVTGLTNSYGFPTENPIQASCDDCGYSTGNLFDGDAFVTKFSADGSSLVYSTYLGGSEEDVGQSIAVDSSGSAYVTGLTQSTDFPTANPFQAANASILLTTTGANAFVAKLKPDGSALDYSTYLGGADEDYGAGIAVDSAGSAYVTGFAQSHNFPTKNPFQATMLGDNDAFVTKFNADGTSLVYSTFLGGQSATQGSSIAVDSFGNAYVTGSTTSNYFPVVGATQTNCLSCSSYTSAFVSQFNATGSALLFSTYLGGSNTNTAFGLALDPSGNAYVAGLTKSTDFPTVAPFQAANKGSAGNAFIAKYSFPPVTALTISPTTIASGTVNSAFSPVTFSATGATGTATFAVTAGPLPRGMTLTPAGVLSGTPTQGGTFAFTLTAADSAGDSGSQNYSLQIACPEITVGPAALPTDTSGTAYSPVTFTESGGIGAATFTESGALPTGMTFASAVLSGTPTQTGSFPLQITATDSASCTGSVSDTLTIYPVGGPPVMVPDNETITVSDTESSAATVPDNETITVSDTEPSNPAVSDNETVKVSDTLPYAQIAIAPLPSSFNTSSGAGTPGAIYGPVTFTASGGSGTLTLSESGGLPPGLTFSDGILSGTLSASSAGTYTFSVSASDVYGDQATEQGYTLTIAAPAPMLKISANPDSLTVVQGREGATTITFTPSGGYAATLALSCSGLPANSLCLFTQNGASVSSVTLTGNNQPVSVALEFETNVNTQQALSGPAQAPRARLRILSIVVFWWPGSLVLGLAAFKRRKKMSVKCQRWLGLCLFVMFTGAAAGGLTGCIGKSSGSYVTPVGSSTVTVTATPASGAAQSLSIDITIQQ